MICLILQTRQQASGVQTAGASQFSEPGQLNSLFGKDFVVLNQWLEKRCGRREGA